MTKDERGDQGIYCWKRNNFIGTLWYTMQFGKTFVGIKAINKILFRNPTAIIYILVPSVIIQKNWKRYLESYVKDQSTIKIITRSQLIDGLDINPDILIIDEIHKFTSEASYAALLKIRCKYILGLTGTYPGGKDKILLDRFCPVIDKISSEEAITNGWITPFIEYNYTIDFPLKDKIRYMKFSEPISETLTLFKGTAKDFNTYSHSELFKTDYQVIDACFRGITAKDNMGRPLRLNASDIRIVIASLRGWNQFMDITTAYGKQTNDYWNPNAIEDRVKTFTNQVRRRNNLMITHPLKLEKINEIVLKFFKPTIIFNESTDFADAVCASINRLGKESIPICTVYHSNIPSRFLRDVNGDIIMYKSGARAGEPKMFGKQTLKEDAINGFETGRYTCLSTSKALDEGLSIPNIQIVITTGGTTNPLVYQQRTARGKTVDIYNPNKETLIVNIVFDNFYDPTIDDSLPSGTNEPTKLIKSRDLSKLIERQVQSNDINWVTNIDEISFTE
jgi:superfamily II DNA or RNA helicase